MKGTESSEIAYLHNQILPSTDFEVDNTRKLSGYVSWNYNLSAGILQDNKNAALDTLFDAALFSDRKHVGLRWSFAQNAFLQFNLRQNEIEDRLPQKQFFRKENLITVNINHKIRRFNYSLAAEYGKSKNFLQSTESDFRIFFRTYLDIGFDIGHFSMRAFSQYYNENIQ